MPHYPDTHDTLRKRPWLIELQPCSEGEAETTAADEKVWTASILKELPESSLVASHMSTVSAQSAFWAVVALALNTACQPPGRVLSSPPAHSRAVRTSPIICLADAFITLYTLITLLVQRHGVRESARATLYWRFHEDGVDPDEQANIEQGWFRALVFIFGALPQTIKIVGLQGVALTQALSMAYLASFAVVELLVYLAGKDRDDFDHAIEQPFYIEDPTTFLRYFAGIAQSCVCHYVLAAVLQVSIPSASDTSHANTEDVRVVIATVPFFALICILSLSFVWSGCLFLGVLLLMPLVHLGFGTTSSSLGIASICLTMVAGTICWCFGMFYVLGTTPIHDFVSLGCGTWSLILVCFFGMLYILIIDIATRPNQSPGVVSLYFMLYSIPEMFEPLFFFLMNLASLLLYCVLLYNPQGTVKPAWTEWLG
ncbi:hypothetical protein MMC11_003962 [Xylographa trunciseda]|nr:hypothetical protein [Xylographa trunciseda]